MDRIDMLARAVEAADWSGADWTHEPAGCACVHECGGNCADEAPVCATCAHAQRDADEARDLGRRAVEAARKGDWGDAVRELSHAAWLERDYGDAPAWQPVADLAAQLACGVPDEHALVCGGEGDDHSCGWVHGANIAGWVEVAWWGGGRTSVMPGEVRPACEDCRRAEAASRGVTL